MLRVLRVSRKALFLSPEGKQFPPKITVLADIKPVQADIDVIIGAHQQPEAVNSTIENYLALEKKARLHILVIESSLSRPSFWKVRNGSNISKVLILSPLRCTSRWLGGRFWASNGAALAAQLGSYLGTARYMFFSHSDMMGYKKNFLSFLLSKLGDDTVLASFTQRHVLPFTGGMLYDKSYFDSMNVDWLPKDKNPYRITGLDQLHDRIDHLSWIDAGEQLVLEALERGKGAYVCASRGLTGDYYGHPLKNYGLTNEGIHLLGVPIQYAPLLLSREEFSVRYPELVGVYSGWRKCFDDKGDVAFVHRGRGTSKGRRKDHRGDFIFFVRDFNNKIAQS